jgi:hypothetical protein
VDVVRARALAAVAVLAALGATSAAAGPDGVSLAIRQYRNTNKVLVLVWYGQTSNGAPGEEVQVVGRDCLTTGFRLFAQTKTAPGGSYQIENPDSLNQPYTYVEVNSGTSFRARWGNDESDPILFRRPLAVYALEFKRNVWTVKVNPSPHNMNLARRFVELQRRQGDTWVRYQRARLVHRPTLDYGGAYNYEATFAVETAGLKLRALVPAKTAAPCYLAGASKPWRS